MKTHPESTKNYMDYNEKLFLSPKTYLLHMTVQNSHAGELAKKTQTTLKITTALCWHTRPLLY